MIVVKASVRECGFRNKVLNHTIYYYCTGAVWPTPFTLTWQSDYSVPLEVQSLG